MEGLFNPVTILLHVINAVILFVVVSKFIYKPVRKFMKAREDKVAQQLAEAKEARAEVGESLKKRDEALRSADQQVENRLAEGRQRLREQETQMLESARAVLGREVKREDHEAMIADFLKKVG